jgi:hypothetical protein
MTPLHPALPFLVGSAAIGALVAALAGWSPMPADLSSRHAVIEGAGALPGCATCHAESGLSAGCLSCHGEIASQLERDRGYHHHLIGEGAPDCARCHAEHHGPSYEPLNEASWGAQAMRGFRHPHVEFRLEGAHGRLACERCHVDARGPAPALPGFAAAPRERSLLGLAQDCDRCHDDPHAGGLSGDCARCHAQDAFAPPTFDHGGRFPLDGAHAGRACRECHDLPAPGAPSAPPPFPFDRARAATCEGCHETPHRAFVDRCDRCHPGADPAFAAALRRVTPALHEPAGFRLRGPHEGVACERCHERDLHPSERYRDPAAPGYLRRETTCQGCHEDAHRGQFAARHEGCLDCHAPDRFAPHAFTSEAHARVYPLAGAHALVDCASCHRLDEALGARRFAGTPRTCRGCHEDPHRGQFDLYGAESCMRCHASEWNWKETRFDHDTARFRLEGKHARAACDRCHVPVAAPGGEHVVRYRPLSRECRSCHEIPAAAPR